MNLRCTRSLIKTAGLLQAKRISRSNLLGLRKSHNLWRTSPISL